MYPLVMINCIQINWVPMEEMVMGCGMWMFEQSLIFGILIGITFYHNEILTFEIHFTAALSNIS